MSGFFWNIRGLNQHKKQLIVKDWISLNRFSFGCLLETRVTETKSTSILHSVFRDWSTVSNYDQHHLGRIWVLWRNDTKVSVLQKSPQVITCLVQLQGTTAEFICSFIYAFNTDIERKRLWSELKAHSDSSVYKDIPWLLCGDFNETLDSSEHSNGTSICNSNGMRDFQDLVSQCGLVDIMHHGPLFTWTNKQNEGLICKKLDRFMCNDAWLSHFPDSYGVFDSGGCSDHLRGRISIVPDRIPRKKTPFKFANVLSMEKDFYRLVDEHWSTSEDLYVSTSALHRLSKKLKSLKIPLRRLARDRLSDITKRTQQSLSNLCNQQTETLQNPSPQAAELESIAYEKWLHLSTIEEGFLKQKSKLHWLRVGDQNNKTFHNAALERRMRNAIRELKGNNRITITDNEEIKSEAIRYFKSILTEVPPSFTGCSVEDLQALLHFRCSDSDQARLVKPVSAEDIKMTVFGMAANKSPGPDGFTADFFKSAWHIVGRDVVSAIQSFFVLGFLPKGVNATILALIPKKEKTVEICDYRPISCCNILYKIISKILADRLKLILPQIVSSNQSAFVKGRLLMENVLLAAELVKDYHKGQNSPRCALMIDLAKAFDSVQWSFLLQTLTALRMPECFIKWIKLCVTTPSFSIQINGELSGYFNSSRGLRQGCPLSPYLFVICMNVLSHLLDSAAASGKFAYHPKCKIMKLTHLCFADDILIFADGKARSVEGVLSIFAKFEDMSGLKVSLGKSSIFSSGINNDILAGIKEAYNIKRGELPVRYLGLPLLTCRMKTSDYRPLVDRIKAKLKSWKARFLSYAGRLQLLKSVIASLINFWISVFRLPKSCIREINSLCSAFLWSGPELSTHKAKVSWGVVCKPRKEGGLGIRDIRESNKVSTMKLIWRALTHNSLWSTWIKTYLLRGENFWYISEKTSGSWIWRKILQIRAAAKPMHRIRIGNGKISSFWYDSWSKLGRFKDLCGDRDHIILDIPLKSSVLQASTSLRRRRYRSDFLATLSETAQGTFAKMDVNKEDQNLWKFRGDKFKTTFGSNDTWNLIRLQNPTVDWHEALWFRHYTPKYNFITWLAINDRLGTGDRICSWTPPDKVKCYFCGCIMETRDHLFFHCTFSNRIWKITSGKIVPNSYSSSWEATLKLVCKGGTTVTSTFLIRYAFHATVYHLWRERNGRRHGKPPAPTTLLIKQIDKCIRNRITSLPFSDDLRQKGLIEWFSTR